MMQDLKVKLNCKSWKMTYRWIRNWPFLKHGLLYLLKDFLRSHLKLDLGAAKKMYRVMISVNFWWKTQCKYRLSKILIGTQKSFCPLYRLTKISGLTKFQGSFICIIYRIGIDQTLSILLKMQNRFPILKIFHKVWRRQNWPKMI